MHAKQPVAQVSLNTRKAVQKAQWKRRVQINETEACTLDWGVQCWQGLEGRRAHSIWTCCLRTKHASLHAHELVPWLPLMRLGRTSLKD